MLNKISGFKHLKHNLGPKDTLKRQEPIKNENISKQQWFGC